MGDGGGGHWLVQMEWHPARWSLCLPLLVFPCTIKSRSSLLASAHTVGRGKRAVKRLWCVVCGVVDILDILVIRSLLWAGVQLTPDPSAETVSKSSALAEERGRQLVGVCVTCGEGRLSRREQPCWAFLGASRQGVAYCLHICPVKKICSNFPQIWSKEDELNKTESLRVTVT